MSSTKQKRIILLSRVIALVMFIVCLTVFAPLVVHFGNALSPADKTAENGELFLQPADFALDKKVAIVDGWKFFESQILLPSQAKSQINQATEMTGQGGWQLRGDRVNGFGTYFLTLHVPNIKQELAIHIPKIDSAYKLFINNQMVASAGKVANSQSIAEPGYNPKVVLIPQGVASVTLTMQVSSFHSTWGGLWSPLIIGNAEDIFATQRDLVALSMFILGVLTITAMFYLIQFYLRPSEKIPLVFAFLCFLLFLRELTNEHMLFVLQFLGVNFVASMKINYLTFYVGVPTVLYFMQLCFPQTFNKNITRLCYVVAFAYALFVLLSPTILIGHSLLTYQIFCLIVTLYLIGNLIIASLQKLPAAKMMLLGVVILHAFAINDMLYALNMVMTGQFFSLGIVGFIICQTYVINYHFEDVRQRNEALSLQLQQRNQELQAFGAELESKVERRTHALEEANKRLQTLADKDPLTGALNRHGMQSYLQTAFERLRRSNEPSSIVLFDFDDFKSINDTYGHDKGDDILKSAVAITNELIREQDKIARWGGEEFLILLPGTELEGAKSMAEKLRQAVQQQLSDTLAPEVPVTITAGVTQFNHNEIFEILFKRADNALYKGKRMGRNCIQS